MSKLHVIALATLVIGLCIFRAVPANAAPVGWTEVTKSDISKTYINFDRIRKANGNIYYWQLVNRFEPSSNGARSYLVHVKVDCELLRTMTLSFAWYRMQDNIGDAAGRQAPEPEWKYAAPYTNAETNSLAVCNA